jgi:general secretion pathway protein D
VRRHRARRINPLFVATACGLLVAACNAIPIGNGDSGDLDVFDKVRSIDLLPRYPSPERQEKAQSGNRARPAIFLGEQETSLAPNRQTTTSGSGGGYDLNFENIPVASVAKIVLGDILGVGYTIDPRVQGTVSLSSGRSVPKSDILFVLENALRLSGVALVRDNTGYRLMPQADAVGAGGLDGAQRAEPGYGISVLPLQYVSAQTLLKLIESFAAKPGMVRANPSHNLIMVQGSGSERQNVIDLAISFDADWMRGQSVGIFPVQNGNPEPMIAELEKIMDSGEGGIGHHVVTFQPIARMNAILAISRNPEVLRRVETWIRRLDNADTGRSAVRVYRVKYGEARQLARLLNDIFTGGGGSSSTLDSAAGQIAPGSGFSSSSSGGGTSASSRLSAGGTGQTGSGFGGGRSQSFGGRSQTGAGSGTNGSMQSGAGAGMTVEDRGAGLFDARGGTGAAGGGSGVLEGVRITADNVNNTLLIYASQEHYSIIERTLRQIDRPQLQVGIEATVAEVTLNDNLNYGVQFFLSSRNLGLPADRGSVLNTTATQAPSPSTAEKAATAFVNRAFPGFNFLIGPENQPNMILDALHAVTDLKVLSNPSVVVIDNQVATLQVGDEVPISTGSATVLTGNNTVVNTIDYRSTGIILRVSPRITANGSVRLEIEQEISNVPTNSGSSPTLTPTVSQRRVRSSVSVANGQTVLLAGLITERQSGSRSGVPVLEQIPGLGEVFSSTGKGTTRTELIIFIRPQIIRDSADAHFVAEELRTKLRGTIGSAGKAPRKLPHERAIKGPG